MWWDERSVRPRPEWQRNHESVSQRCERENGEGPKETRWDVVVDLDCPYTREAVLSAFRRNAGKWSVTDLSQGECKSAAPDVYWGEYERIDWESVASGKVCANCYCIRKGLIRKAQLALVLTRWCTKYPHSEIARSVPETFVFELYDIEYFEEVLIADVPELREMKPGETWILKPNVTNQALGVHVFNELGSLKAALCKEEAWNLREWVVQRYIANPLLVDKKKFHIRVYVLAVGALKVYVYDDMLALFATEDYDYSPDSLSNLDAHLTNTCHATHSGASEEDMVRLLDEIPTSFPGNKAAMQRKVDDTKKTIRLIVGQCFDAVSSDLSLMPMQNCFELFGFDFLLDDEWRVWFLEANAEPDVKQTGERLHSVISDMISGACEYGPAGLMPTGLKPAKGNKWVEVLQKHMSGSQNMKFRIT